MYGASVMSWLCPWPAGRAGRVSELLPLGPDFCHVTWELASSSAVNSPCGHSQAPPPTPPPPNPPSSKVRELPPCSSRPIPAQLSTALEGASNPRAFLPSEVRAGTRWHLLWKCPRLGCLPSLPQGTPKAAATVETTPRLRLCSGSAQTPTVSSQTDL